MDITAASTTHSTAVKLAPLSSLVGLIRKRIPDLTTLQVPTKSAAAAWLSKQQADARGADGNMSTSDGQSYLAKLSPWGARSPVVKPAQGSDSETAPGDVGLKQTKGSDHKVTHRHKISLRKYPKDCPPLVVHWFFATDVPKRRPTPIEVPSKSIEKPQPAPRKYAPFSKTDSKAIEAAFRKLAEEEDAAEQPKYDDEDDPSVNSTSPPATLDPMPNASFEQDKKHSKPDSIKVPVNEDYLFDVDIEQRELGPAYWLGPIYEVRRGTWFYQGKPLTCSSRLHNPCLGKCTIWVANS